MSDFIVSARKYRPITFDNVVGQLSITTTLKNAIENQKLAHAYLFTGPRGVGKTTCARIFAKTINCFNLDESFDPCNECESCLSFNKNRSYNIHELDAASNNSVEDIRSLIEQVRIPPQVGKYSVYIIDEVHMLSSAAFNAFLKTLEEPPPHVVFILATTEKNKILATILSRCQIFDFNRITVDDSVDFLSKIAIKEKIEVNLEALNVIAQKADGAMRDALSFFDQIVSFSGKKISYQNVIDNLNVLDYDYYFRLTDAFAENDIPRALLIFNSILEKGFDGHHFITGLGEHFRNLLVSKDNKTLELLEVGASIKEKYKKQANNSSVNFLFKALQISSNCDINYKNSRNKRLHIELSLLQMCDILKQKEKQEIIKKVVNEKKEKLENEKIVNEKKENLEDKKIEIKKIEIKQNEKIEIKKEEEKKPNIKKSKLSSLIKKREEKKLKKISDFEEKNISELEINKDFNEKDIKNNIEEFANSIKEDENLNVILKSINPVLKENFLIELNVNSNIAEKRVKEKHNKLLEFFRRNLKNNKIELNIKIIKNIEKISQKRLSKIDKYNYLKNKNPKISSMKSMFDLGF
ncbi:MAG: hypothetical protein B6I24_01415 [Bacteroidetes bacterium 4572_128]|nr:MAG: hypothetical protein B6I24_01415 [Bacteroidetes bacterium 4572_128]